MSCIFRLLPGSAGAAHDPCRSMKHAQLRFCWTTRQSYWKEQSITWGKRLHMHSICDIVLHPPMPSWEVTWTRVFRYPYNLDFDYGGLEGLQKFSINNLGDPFIESNYGVHSREFEVVTTSSNMPAQHSIMCYQHAIMLRLLTHRLEFCNGLQSSGRLIVKTFGATSQTVELKATCTAFLLAEKTIQTVCSNLLKSHLQTSL